MTPQNAPATVAVDRIETLLAAAATAHGEYEAAVLGGVHDVEWPRWYAEHIARSLTEQGLEIIEKGADHGTA